MQPRNGLKVVALRVGPAYRPLKKTDREVVTPGDTGLPTWPGNATSTRRPLTTASVPPTTPRWPGHSSRYCVDVREAPNCAGTTTQGPGTRARPIRPGRPRPRPPGT